MYAMTARVRIGLPSQICAVAAATQENHGNRAAVAGVAPAIGVENYVHMRVGGRSRAGGRGNFGDARVVII